MATQKLCTLVVLCVTICHPEVTKAGRPKLLLDVSHFPEVNQVSFDKRAVQVLKNCICRSKDWDCLIGTIANESDNTTLHVTHRPMQLSKRKPTKPFYNIEYECSLVRVTNHPFLPVSFAIYCSVQPAPTKCPGSCDVQHMSPWHRCSLPCVTVSWPQMVVRINKVLSFRSGICIDKSLHSRFPEALSGIKDKYSVELSTPGTSMPLAVIPKSLSDHMSVEETPDTAARKAWSAAIAGFIGNGSTNPDYYYESDYYSSTAWSSNGFTKHDITLIACSLSIVFILSVSGTASFIIFHRWYYSLAKDDHMPPTVSQDVAFV